MAAATKPASINEALLATQKDVPKLQKNAVNPHFKNKYISLDALMEQILPVLNSHGLVLVQEPGYMTINSNMINASESSVEPTLTTTLIHAPSGQMRMSTMPLMLDKDNPQGQGSAITYARRYSLMAILGLVADTDDDGEKAASKTSRARPKATEPADDSPEWTI